METAHSSLIASPKNFKKHQFEIEKGKDDLAKHLKDQTLRFRELQKTYRKRNEMP
jgi:hypothetical protein